MTANELYYKYGEKVEIPQGATEAFMMTEYHFVKALEEYTDQAITDTCKRQREICAEQIKDMNFTLSEIVRVSPSPKESI